MSPNTRMQELECFSTIKNKESVAIILKHSLKTTSTFYLALHLLLSISNTSYIMSILDTQALSTFEAFKYGKAQPGHEGFIKLSLVDNKIQIVATGPRMEWEQLCSQVLEDDKICWVIY